MTMMSMRDVAPWMRGVRAPSPMRSDGALSPFAALRQEIDRLFDEALHGFGLRGFDRPGEAGWPSVEVAETDREIRVTFEMPGIAEKDVEVLLEDGVLVVRGERRSETEDRNRRFTERFYGRFERRIPLGDGLQEDGIQAEFRNGLLTVTVPRTARAEQRARRIPVNAG